MKKVITFDFDDTLCTASPGAMVTKAAKEEFPAGIISQVIIEQLELHHQEGDSVNILTTRKDIHMEEVHNFVEYFKLGDILDNVWNTNFLWKAEYITEKGLKIDKHFDDNLVELHYFNELQLSTEFVHIDHWRRVDKLRSFSDSRFKDTLNYEMFRIIPIIPASDREGGWLV